MLMLLGPFPFLMQLGAFYLEETTGDPPNSLAEFKGYHYWMALTALVAVGWLAAVVAYFPAVRRRIWLLALCGGWTGWVLWLCYWFLRELHRHSAGEYYWSLWLHGRYVP